MASPYYQTSLENNFVTPYSSFSGANAGSSFFNAGAENTVSGSRFGNWIKRNIARAVAFNAGADAGFVAGALSTANFVGGLFTGESWVAMGQGFVNMAILGSPVPSVQQVMMRAQIVQGVGDYVSSLPNKSAFELGYDAGYVGEKFTESVALGYGAGFVLNGIKTNAGASQVVSRIGSLKNISGTLDDAARLARNQKYGPVNNVFRRLPRSTQDILALEGAQAGKGRRIIKSLSDPRYRGWEKWHYSVGPRGSKSVVHYIRDPKTGYLTDFKFK